MHNDDAIHVTSGDLKPEVIPVCNSTKGSVDVTDRLKSENVSRISNQWPPTSFSLLNIVAINSQTVFR